MMGRACARTRGFEIMLHRDVVILLESHSDSIRQSACKSTHQATDGDQLGEVPERREQGISKDDKQVSEREHTASLAVQPAGPATWQSSCTQAACADGRERIATRWSSRVGAPLDQDLLPLRVAKQSQQVVHQLHRGLARVLDGNAARTTVRRNSQGREPPGHSGGSDLHQPAKLEGEIVVFVRPSLRA